METGGLNMTSIIASLSHWVSISQVLTLNWLTRLSWHYIIQSDHSGLNIGAAYKILLISFNLIFWEDNKITQMSDIFPELGLPSTLYPNIPALSLRSCLYLKAIKCLRMPPVQLLAGLGWPDWQHKTIPAKSLVVGCLSSQPQPAGDPLSACGLCHHGDSQTASTLTNNNVNNHHLQALN